MEAMRLAFHKTCKALQLSANDDVFTEIVATRIIELANSAIPSFFETPFQIRSATGQHRRHGGVSGGGKGRGQGL
jgi:hypothetical protein